MAGFTAKKRAMIGLVAAIIAEGVVWASIMLMPLKSKSDKGAL